MAERRLFRVLRTRAAIDTLVSYQTDAKAVVADHASWIANHHVNGAAFVDEVLGPFDAVLEASAKLSKETAEAVAATQYQDSVLTQAATLTSTLRKRGEFIASELDRKENNRAEAAKVRAACGAGSRINVKRQTGLRRMLMIQQAGLSRIEALWTKWNPTASGQPSDKERVAQALAHIEVAIKGQAKEQLEAQMAADELEDRVLLAVDSMNRVIRLVNSVAGELPAQLQAGLESLETRHPDVFWTQGDPDEPSAPPAPTDDPTRPVD
jgi:hypothetical protein